MIHAKTHKNSYQIPRNSVQIIQIAITHQSRIQNRPIDSIVCVFSCVLVEGRFCFLICPMCCCVFLCPSKQCLFVSPPHLMLGWCVFHKCYSAHSVSTLFVSFLLLFTFLSLTLFRSVCFFALSCAQKLYKYVLLVHGTEMVLRRPKKVCRIRWNFAVLKHLQHIEWNSIERSWNCVELMKESLRFGRFQQRFEHSNDMTHSNACSCTIKKMHVNISIFGSLCCLIFSSENHAQIKFMSNLMQTFRTQRKNQPLSHSFPNVKVFSMQIKFNVILKIAHAE